MELSELERAVLKFVRAETYRPVKARVIHKSLGLSDDKKRELRRAVKRLVRLGCLKYGRNHLVFPPEKAPSNRIVGTFRRMPAGFGFVRPEPTTSPAGALDVYVSAKNAHDASSGDKVLVHVVSNRRGGAHRNPDGAIVEVLERESHRFVGSYFERSGQAFVQVDGTVFVEPVFVGDPGAKNARLQDRVVLEMVRFPSHVQSGEGVIVEVLGSRGTPGVDTLSIIHEYGLPQEFPEDVLAEAREQGEVFDATKFGERRDMTEEAVVTIDPEDARDFDDAISLSRLENGHWRLGVHIADVAHFVRPKSALDREARSRSTSVYLPDRVIPMLPEVISNALASLQPNQIRFTKTVWIEFTDKGAPVAADVASTAIKSKRRFTYEEVDNYLARPSAWRKKLDAGVHALLGRMHELAMILRRRRFERGSLELSLRDVKVELDKDGRVTGAKVVENLESHQIIEEFMLAANEAVARTLQNAGVFFLRRIHPSPDLRKLRDLTHFVQELGCTAESLESRFALQQLLRTIGGRPEEHAVNYAVLRSLQRAVYSPREEEHYALASDCYCHFTSPIRRYPDLTVHRAIDALLSNRKPRESFDDLIALGAHCSDREQRAEAAERELTKIKLLDFLSSRIGLEMDALITGVESFGLFVQGIELPAEGLVHVNSLADDFYHYDKTSHTLSGHRKGNTFRLGDQVRVAVGHVDLDRRQLDFRIIDATSTKRDRDAGRQKRSKISDSRRKKTPTAATRTKKSVKKQRSKGKKRNTRKR